MRRIVVVFGAFGIMAMASTTAPASVTKETKCRNAKIAAMTKMFRDMGKCRKKTFIANDNGDVFLEADCEDAAMAKCEAAFNQADETYGVECSTSGDGGARCGDVYNGYFDFEVQLF